MENNLTVEECSRCRDTIECLSCKEMNDIDFIHIFLLTELNTSSTKEVAICDKCYIDCILLYKEKNCVNKNNKHLLWCHPLK